MGTMTKMAAPLSRLRVAATEPKGSVSSNGQSRVTGMRKLLSVTMIFALMLEVSASLMPAETLAQGKLTILEAAERLNMLTPQSIPIQTLRIGSYDFVEKKFYWG